MLFQDTDAEATSGAILSPDRLYRYALWRAWNQDRPRVNFVMLNPSTADEAVDDPTIRRCIGFAKAWGYGSLGVTNLFAFRATDPAALRTVPDPVGPDNDRVLASAADLSEIVVFAWGECGRLAGRAAYVAHALRGHRLHYLRRNKSGSPAHPLYLPANLTPIPWTSDRSER